MRDRVDAYIRVMGHAQRAGISPQATEMQEFVRSLFWMAREAGAYGLPRQAKLLFDLARANALRSGWDYRVFALAAATLGWVRAGKLAQLAGRWRR